MGGFTKIRVRFANVAQLKEAVQHGFLPDSAPILIGS